VLDWTGSLPVSFQCKSYQRYLLHKPSYSRFCLKFRCHGNKGHSG